MSKKHKKKQHHHAYGYAANGAASPYGAPPQYGMPPPYGAAPQAGYNPETTWPGADYAGVNPGYGAPGYGAPGYGTAEVNHDFLKAMSGYLPSRHTDQFLMGLLIGAGAAWVLSDEEIRGKLMKAAMKVYAGVAGGFEELKEQMADIRADVAAERHGDD
jgi:hypothetical protein